MMKYYMTIKDAAKLWGISARRIQILCRAGRVPGAERAGRIWLIPEGTKKPGDARVKSGVYRDWRKFSSDEGGRKPV